MIYDLVRRDLKHFGVRKTIYDVSVRAINHLFYFRILRGMGAERIRPQCLQLDAKYRHGFLDPATLRYFAKDSQYQISENFLEQAFARGDQCYGIVDGDILAYSGWFSTQPTQIDPPDLMLHFRSDHVYMYKAFTHRRYRGQGLHPAGLSMAVDSYLKHGARGVVAYNESNNFSALAAGARVGHANFGNIYVAKLLNRYLIYSSKGCERYGFRLSVIRREPAGAASAVKQPIGL